MDASHVMVTNVISVGPDATVQEVADTLLRNHVSAVPVLDKDGRLLGIVSEGDLFRRPESGTERQPSVWLELFASSASLANEFVRSHSRKVSDVMTRDVITVTLETSVAEVAKLLEQNRIKRVPVMKAGKVVGIVSRANLLQALASMKDEWTAKLPPADSTIRDKILEQLNSKSWTRPSLFNVTVRDGTAELWGMVDSQAEKKAVRVLAEVIPGVRAVKDNLVVRPISSNV